MCEVSIKMDRPACRTFTVTAACPTGLPPLAKPAAGSLVKINVAGRHPHSGKSKRPAFVSYRTIKPGDWRVCPGKQVRQPALRLPKHFIAKFSALWPALRP